MGGKSKQILSVLFIVQMSLQRYFRANGGKGALGIHGGIAFKAHAAAFHHGK